MFFDGSYLAFELILAGILFFLAAPWVAMGVPQAKRPLQLSALGGLIHAGLGFFGGILYAQETLRSVLSLAGNALFWGGIAATVYFVCLAAKGGAEEVR